MGRSQETFNKKEVRNKKEKKRKEKEKKRLAKKDSERSGSLDDMIAYVDENGVISSTPPDPSKRTEIKSEDIEISVPSRESDPDYDPVKTGKLIYFNHSKAYGFIREQETQESIFVHASNFLDDIQENSMVSFEIVKGPKGPTATSVRLVRK